MDIDKRILGFCLREWSKYFTGTNSYDLSHQLNIEHRQVRESFQRLKNMNQGTLDEDVVLRQVKKESDAFVAIQTTTFYPSKRCLEMNFKSQKVTEKAPEFKKRLLLGQQPSDLCYFSQSVLQKYLDAPEKYNFQDSLCGGFISSNKKYLSDLNQEDKNFETVGTIRFGKRKVDDTQLVVTAILEDLSILPEKEQQHWYLSEVEKPDFSFFDPDFHKYHLNYYNSASIDTYNPLKGIFETFKKINALPHVGRLFKETGNKGMKYPVSKKLDDFSNSCDKLYQYIGPENINRKILKKFLKKNYNYKKEDFIDAKTEQPFTNQQLFKKLLKELGISGGSIDKLIKAIQKHKIPADHQIQSPRHSNPDYLTEYKKLCKSLLISFNILYQKLNKKIAPNQRDLDQKDNVKVAG